MSEFFSEYGLFLAKAITIIIGFVIVITVAAAAAQSRPRRDDKGEIVVTPLNEFFEDLQEAIKHNVLSKEELKEDRKQKKKEEKQKKKQHKKEKDEERKKRIFVLDFDGDVKASGVECLAMEITAILTMAEEQDEVLLRLESPGGQVHAYGLAASQLQRIRQQNINLVICVDKVAASGGYMMACIANKIIAAPFAILGSVGVVAELPNFNRVLKKYDVDYDIYTAGQFKRTVTMLGENTPEGKQKFVDEIEETHVLFKDMVAQQRPTLDIDSVATGEHWYGSQCLEKGLVDEIKTSEDYLFEASKECDLFEISYEVKQSMMDRLGFAAEGTVSRIIERTITTLTSSGKKIV